MAESFLRRCLLLDLETRGRDQILRIGAVLRDQILERRGGFRLEAALDDLDRLAGQADFILGHNLLGHDLAVLTSLAPSLALLRKPVVDTLYLSPLAFPENPYHHLVKDYKLVRTSLNDPVADAKLAARVFRDQWQSFSQIARSEPELLAFYAFCLVHDADRHGLATVFEEIAGRSSMTWIEALRYLETSFAETVCRSAIGELLRRELADPTKRPAWAYSAAWLRVAGGNSVLPPWVRHRYPDTTRILHVLRDVPCSEPGCTYCHGTHDPQTQLRRFFGFESFRPAPATSDGESLQGAIARDGLADRPHLAILATGAGKSICFQLPALARYFRRGVLTVVISPLQALMKDQVDNLNAATGTECSAALYGLLTPPERGAIHDRVRLGDIALLYVAPEQLRNASFRRTIEQREVATWVFDEAHCLSKWGHDFRPDYLYAARFIKTLAARQGAAIPPVACFTATAKNDVKQEIVEHFDRELGFELRVFESGVERDELRFRVEAVSPAEKLERIHTLVEECLTPATGSAVVYFATRRGSDQGAEYLHKKGVTAAAFHAGLKPPEKRDVLDAFVSGALPVVCATNAFGMGIDKDDVRLVIHADIPGSLENYLQEAGRAGRDRVASDCVLLFDGGDLEKQFKLASSSRLSQRDIAQILRALRRARRRDDDEVVVTSGELLRDEQTATDFDAGDRQADTKVKTAVSWLERAGFMERDENRTRVFQGRLRVASLDEAKERIAKLAPSLRLTQAEQRRWLALLAAMINADPDQGLTADELAELPGVAWRDLAPDDRESPGQKVLRILHDMAETGLLDSGLRLTAYVRSRGRNPASGIFEAVCGLERAMLGLLRESEPEADSGEWFELSLRLLNQRLVDQGHTSNPATLRKLLRSLSEDGKGLAGRRGSLELSYRARDCYRVRLLRNWANLEELADRRRALGRVLLDRLLAEVPAEAAGKVLVEFGSDELTEAIRRDLVLRGQIRDPLAAAERGLLFLHEQKVIQLQQGLAVFRQAMSIRIRPDAKGRRYSQGDYSPLAHHYGERTFQIHVMGRYAELGMEKIRSALALVQDYFRLGKKRFVGDYFAGEDEILKRATGQESFRRIVDRLGNPGQIRLVAAPVERNLLVLAGPGSGKTRVVVHRCAYLLRVERIPARSILVLCFNRNAALELRRRLRELAGDDARGVTVGTYHSLAMRLTGTSFATLGQTDGGAREPEFDRLIPAAIRLLSDPDGLPGLAADELRDHLLAGYSHILVDEYQDINREQYELVSAIAGRTDPDRDRKLAILAVGDDDQNIYTFTGANVEFIRRFQQDYQAQVHYLIENYRSTAHIIACANQLIAHNRDRMKLRQPIRINEARRGHPLGGRWASLEPHTAGRVELQRLPDAGTQAAALAQRLLRVKRIDPQLEWRDCAVLARRHAVLEPIRAVLEHVGVPVRWSAEAGRLPPLGRIREIAAFLEALEEHRRELRRASELETLRQELIGERGENSWWALVAEILREWREESHDAELGVVAALDFFYEALAERRREPAFGNGVRLATVHAAKGLEFRHVFMPDGDWELLDGQGPEEERRLYYVGITRACEMLSLYARGDCRNPHLPLLDGEFLQCREPRVDAPPPTVLRRRYDVLTLRDLFLSYAGQRAVGDRIHHRLAGLEPGDPLRARRAGAHVRLLDASDEVVATLSADGRQRWGERLDDIESLRILAMVKRRAEDSEGAYRSRLRCEQWEVPVVEVIYRQAGA